jgi:arylsulfatase/arylsulfatase A
VLPTLLDACGVERPAGLKLDGRSMLLELKGAKVKRPSRTIYIQGHRGDRPVLYNHFAARNEMWKLVHPTGFGRESFSGEPKLELYNMLADPLETNNVADQHADVVAKMKRDYEAWFRDVSGTRPDNYAPPRIHVGTPHENPTVLTRQDWRHTHGRPWHRDSMGHWLLYVTGGAYDIRCRFTPNPEAGEAVLTIDDAKHRLDLPAGATSCVFENVGLEEGNIRLEVVLTHGGTSRGIHQADVIRR